MQDQEDYSSRRWLRLLGKKLQPLEKVQENDIV